MALTRASTTVRTSETTDVSNWPPAAFTLLSVLPAGFQRLGKGWRKWTVGQSPLSISSFPFLSSLALEMEGSSNQDRRMREATSSSRKWGWGIQLWWLARSNYELRGRQNLSQLHPWLMHCRGQDCRLPHPPPPRLPKKPPTHLEPEEPCASFTGLLKTLWSLWKALKHYFLFSSERLWRACRGCSRPAWPPLQRPLEGEQWWLTEPLHSGTWDHVALWTHQVCLRCQRAWTRPESLGFCWMLIFIHLIRKEMWWFLTFCAEKIWCPFHSPMCCCLKVYRSLRSSAIISCIFFLLKAHCKERQMMKNATPFSVNWRRWWALSLCFPMEMLIFRELSM